MEETEQKIIESLSEIKSLVNEYKSIKEKIQIDQSQLSNLAKQIQSERSVAEQQAMYLEDCIGHSPADLKHFYSYSNFSVLSRNSMNYRSPHESKRKIPSKKEAYEKLLGFYQKTKFSSSQEVKNMKMNQEIDEMMLKINSQHQLLLKAEEEIEILRKKEAEAKRVETEQYEKLMKQMNDISDKFQDVRNKNKEKKKQLEKIEESNIELRKNIEKSKGELQQSNELLKEARTNTRELTDRRQFSQIQLKKLRKTEDRLNKIRMENSKLSTEEIQLNNTLGKLTIEFEGKKNQLQQIFSQIASIENSIDGTMNSTFATVF